MEIWLEMENPEELEMKNLHVECLQIEGQWAWNSGTYMVT